MIVCRIRAFCILSVMSQLFVNAIVPSHIESENGLLARSPGSPISGRRKCHPDFSHELLHRCYPSGTAREGVHLRLALSVNHRPTSHQSWHPLLRSQHSTIRPTSRTYPRAFTTRAGLTPPWQPLHQQQQQRTNDYTQYRRWPRSSSSPCSAIALLRNSHQVVSSTPILPVLVRLNTLGRLFLPALCVPVLVMRQLSPVRMGGDDAWTT